ncbi:AlpA family phage regulatory protein [Aeromonas caviae]|nr:AlpA family phage regulatory protein [Aeromonas caviae]
MREAIRKTGLSKSSIYDLMAQGQFPPNHTSGWALSGIRRGRS